MLHNTVKKELFYSQISASGKEARIYSPIFLTDEKKVLFPYLTVKYGRKEVLPDASVK